MMEKPLIVITGSAGFLGQPLTKLLLKRGYNVIGVDIRKPADHEYFTRTFTNHFVFVEGNIQDSYLLTHLQNTIKGKEAILVHLAGITHPDDCNADILKAFDMNCTLVLMLEQWAHHVGIKQILFSSTALVYGNNLKKPAYESDPVMPDDVYAMTKSVAEKILETCAKKDEIPITILRLSNVYGPNNISRSVLYKILSQAFQSGAIKLKNLSSRRNFIYVDDVVEAFFKTITHPQKKPYSVYNIAADSSITIFSLAKKIARLAGILQKHITCECKDEKDVSTLFVSNKKAKKELHWRPLISINDGLRKIVDKSSFIY